MGNAPTFFPQIKLPLPFPAPARAVLKSLHPTRHMGPVTLQEHGLQCFHLQGNPWGKMCLTLSPGVKVSALGLRTVVGVWESCRDKDWRLRMETVPKCAAPFATLRTPPPMRSFQTFLLDLPFQACKHPDERKLGCFLPVLDRAMRYCFLL